MEESQERSLEKVPQPKFNLNTEEPSITVAMPNMLHPEKEDFAVDVEHTPTGQKLHVVYTPNSHIQTTARKAKVWIVEPPLGKMVGNQAMWTFDKRGDGDYVECIFAYTQALEDFGVP